MSVVVNIIDKVARPVFKVLGLEKVWDSVVLGAQWFVDNVVEPVFEEIFSWFGIEDQEILHGQVGYSKLAPDSGKNGLNLELIEIMLEKSAARCGVNSSEIIDAVDRNNLSQKRLVSFPIQFAKGLRNIDRPNLVTEVKILTPEIAEIIAKKDSGSDVELYSYSIGRSIIDIYVKSILEADYGLVNGRFDYAGESLLYHLATLNIGSGYYEVTGVRVDGTIVAGPNIQMEQAYHYLQIEYRKITEVADARHYISVVETAVNDPLMKTYLSHKGNFITVSEMFPLVAIRESGLNINGVSDLAYVDYYSGVVDTSKDTPEMPTTDKSMFSESKLARYNETELLLKSMGLSYDSLTTGICAQDNVSNLANITDAYVGFMIDPHSDKEIVSKALYYAAKKIVEISTQEEYSNEGLSDASTNIANNTRIGKISFSANMNVAFSFESTNTTIASSKYTVGTYRSSVSGNDLTVEHQSGSNVLERYVLKKLTSFTHLRRSGLQTVVTTGLTDGDSKFYMPLIIEMIDGLTAKESAELYSESLHLITYASEIQYLEWYQTTAFMSFVMIIIVIASIVYVAYTGNFSGAQMMINFAISYGVQYVFQMEANRITAEAEAKTADMNRRMEESQNRLKNDLDGRLESEVDASDLVDIISDVELLMTTPVDDMLYMMSSDYAINMSRPVTEMNINVCPLSTKEIDEM